jgi:hypothetical protein
MLARDAQDRLLAAMVDLYGGEAAQKAESSGAQAEESALPRDAFAGMLEPEEERLVGDVRNALARIMGAVAASSRGPAPPPSVMVGVLGGAELLMRAEIAAGRVERVLELLPSFAFLATLPYLRRDEALRLAERTRELAEGGEREA